MSFTRQKAEQRVSGLEYEFNDHLIKIYAFDNFRQPLRDHWRKEIRAFVNKLRVIGLKPNDQPPSAQFFFDLLYREPFEGNEVKNVAVHFDEIRDDYAEEGDYATTPTKTPEQSAAWLHDFHEALADRLSKDEDPRDLVP
jgi:hypothetical protein